jgi:hypothetical protein
MKIKTMKSKSGTSADMPKTAISMDKMTSRPVESSGSYPLPNTLVTILFYPNGTVKNAQISFQDYSGSYSIVLCVEQQRNAIRFEWK